MQRNQRSPDLLIGAQATVNDLKQRACSELAETAQQNYGFTNGFPSGDLASIVLSSGTIVINFHASSLMLFRFAWSTRL